ncbi:MAG: ATP-binding protein [Desulfopila sp.]
MAKKHMDSMNATDPDKDYFPRGRSLSHRFGTLLSLVVVGILVFFSLAIVVYNSLRMEDQLQRQLSDTLKLAETSLPTAVWQMDHGSMNDILEAILVNDTIASVRILTDGMAAASKEQVEYEDRDFSFFQQSRNFTVKSIAVKRFGETVGLFEVAISRSKIQQGVLATIFVLLGLVVILCGAIILTSFLFTRQYIFKPLMRLESHARLVAAGNLESSIEIAGDDELAQLAHAFNAMATQLKISFDTLEQKVMERTADLYLAKTEAEKMNHHLNVVGAELQALLDNSPVGILFVNFDRVIQRVNPEFLQITGYTQEELIGYTTRKLYPFEEDYVANGKAHYPILRRQGFVQKNVAIRTRDGEIRMCSWRGKVIAGENHFEGVVWSLEDISRRLKLEEDMLKVKKMESIGVLAGGIAHDFNNLLLAILGNISLAQRMAPQSSRIVELLDSAKKASERAKDLTAKLLTFSSGGEPVYEAESLPQLLEEAASFALTGSNVKCGFHFPEELWAVKMDKGQINQVVQNLILNADQAMPEGGQVRISCSNVEVAQDGVARLEEGIYVKVEIKDDGGGIAEEHVAQIFDPYFSTKQRDSNRGSGLGLAIVHSIINKHGGGIHVDSRLGEGSTFTMYLPALAEAKSKTAQVREEALNSGSGTILVMDDEEIIRDVVSSMLTQLGYKAVSVADGQEAIERYEANLGTPAKFDAVIMDLTIPGGMGGKETVQKILALDPAAKVIVSSGYSQDPVLDDFRALGFCNVVNKPYQLEDLSRVLVTTLVSSVPRST